MKNKTATECWNILRGELDSAIDSFVPMKKQGKRSKKKHLSKEAFRKIRHKQNMWRVYKHTGKDQDYVVYKEALNAATKQISKPLAHVFNMSLQEGIVPLEWKEANIIPLFKKGSRNKSVNYRPVSLTSVICKLLETIIRDHMIDFLVKHKLINPSQHGFLKARSCLTNLLWFF